MSQIGLLLDADDRMLYTVPLDDGVKHQALRQWLHFHHLDPRRIPAGSVVIRYAARKRIECCYLPLDKDGRTEYVDPLLWGQHRHIEQGEGAPLPIPAELLDDDPTTDPDHPQE